MGLFFRFVHFKILGKITGGKKIKKFLNSNLTVFILIVAFITPLKLALPDVGWGY